MQLRELTPAEKQLVECILLVRQTHLECVRASGGRVTNRRARKYVVRRALELFYWQAGRASLEAPAIASLANVNYWRVALELSESDENTLAGALLARGASRPNTSSVAFCEAFECTPELRPINPSRRDLFCELSMAHALTTATPDYAAQVLIQLLWAHGARHAQCYRGCVVHLDCEQCRDRARDFSNCGLHDNSRLVTLLRWYLLSARSRLSPVWALGLIGRLNMNRNVENPCVSALFAEVVAAMATVRYHGPVDQPLDVQLYPWVIGQSYASEFLADPTGCRYAALVAREKAVTSAADRIMRANPGWHFRTTGFTGVWPAGLVNQAMARVLPRRTLNYAPLRLARYSLRLVGRLMELDRRRGAASSEHSKPLESLLRIQRCCHGGHDLGVSVSLTRAVRRFRAQGFSQDIGQNIWTVYSDIVLAASYWMHARRWAGDRAPANSWRSVAGVLRPDAGVWLAAADAWRMFSALETEPPHDDERRAALDNLVAMFRGRIDRDRSLVPDLLGVILPSLSFLTAGDVQRITAGF